MTSLAQPEGPIQTKSIQSEGSAYISKVQSVQVVPAAAKATIDNRPFDITEAFPVREELTGLFLEFTLASFLFVNLIISSLLLQLEWMSPVRASLENGLALLFAALAVPVAGFIIYGLGKRVYRHMQQRFVTPDLCYLLALTLMAALTFHSLLFKRENLFGLSWDQNLVVVLFLLSAIRISQYYLIEPIRRRLGFSLREMAPNVTRVGLAGVTVSPDVTNGDGRSNEEIVNSEVVSAGDLFKVSVGEIIPLDGIVINGKGQVNEIRYTGYSELRHKHANDAVFAGSKLISGEIYVRATASQDEASITNFSSILNAKVTSDLSENLEHSKFAVTLASFAVISLGLIAAIVWTARDASFLQITNIFAALALSVILPQFIALLPVLRPLAETSSFRAGGLAAADRNSFLVDKLSQVQRLIVDFRSDSYEWEREVATIELVDRRVAENSLLSAIFAMSGRAQSPIAKAISHYLSANYRDLRLLSVSDFSEYEGRGVCAKIEGHDFTLGDEDLLLERGVLLQQSEMTPANGGEEIWYVALNEEIIARVLLAPAFSSSARATLEAVRRLGVRPVFCSMEPGTDLDSIGKGLGLELTEVFGGLTPENLIRKIESMNPAAIIMNRKSDREISRKSAASLSLFDELVWDLNRSDIVLFAQPTAILARLFTLARSYRQVVRQNWIFAGALYLVLVILGASGYVTPAISCAAVFTGGVALILNSYRLLNA